MKSRIRARIDLFCENNAKAVICHTIRAYTINKPMLVFDILSKYLKKKECILSLLKIYDYIFIFKIIHIFN